MMVSRRRKRRHLSLGLLVLVLVGAVMLLSHLWTSDPDGRRNPLRQIDRNSDAEADDGSVRRLDRKHGEVSAIDDKPDDNQLNAKPEDDNQSNAEPLDKVGVPQDAVPNAAPLHGNKNVVLVDDNQITVPQEDRQRDAVSFEENDSNAVPPDESNAAVPSDTVPEYDDQPGEVPLNERKHGTVNAVNPSKADLQTINPHSVTLVQPGTTSESTGERKNVPELGPRPSIEADLSADEFVGKREVPGFENERLLPILLRNETGTANSAAQVGSFQSTVPGKDVDNRNVPFGTPRNEMNRNDFAADADKNAHFPLPMKSRFMERNGDGGKADRNSTNEFESGIRATRGNRSNVSSGVGASGGGIRVVSMSLYGADLRYTMGAIRNAELVKDNFPGWTLRMYMESPASSAPRFGPVPRNVVEKLRSQGVDIHYIVPEQDFIPPLMWRFLVADDLSVDRFIIRDSDSRLTVRDSAAVSAWIRSGEPFHSIRDHPSHASYAVSGGLWGGRTKELRNILRRSWIDLMRGTSSQYLEDMNFLNNVVWPRVQFRVFCSDSVSCDRWPNSHPFPVARHGYDHVGQVFDERDIGRPVDIRILRAAGENPRCAVADGS